MPKFESVFTGISTKFVKRLHKESYKQPVEMIDIVYTLRFGSVAVEMSEKELKNLISDSATIIERAHSEDSNLKKNLGDMIQDNGDGSFTYL